MITVACIQFSPEKAKLAANLDRIAALAKEAQGEGAEIVTFSESATSGYFVEGGAYECSLTSEELAGEISSRFKGSPALDFVIGFYERSGNQLFNSAAYLEWNGSETRAVHTYRKFYLPTYGVFDEERFVGRGTELGVFDTRFGRFAILICEDVWHSILPTFCAVAGAEVLFVPSASPGRGFASERPSNLTRYEALLSSISQEHGIFCVNAQLCGFEGGKGFVGGSLMTDPTGRVMGQGPLMEEHILIGQIDLDQVGIARAQSPLISDLRGTWSDLLRMAESISP